MKREFQITRLIAITIIILAVILKGQTQEIPAGNGTLMSPYQISSMGHLYWMSQNSDKWSSYFEQMNDIDASETINWNDHHGWLPLGDETVAFSGNYDGGGFYINKLYINRPTTNNVGFIGQADSCTVRNAYFANINITAEDRVGGIVGSGIFALENVCCWGTIAGNDDIGGLVGYAPKGTTLDECYANISIQGVNRVGGLVGNCQGDINECYTLGSINATSMGGGLIGRMFGSILTDCYANMDINVIQYPAGVVGFNEVLEAPFPIPGFEPGEARNCFWNIDKIENGYNGAFLELIGKKTDLIKTKTTFTEVGWDFTSIWDLDDNINESLPFLVDIPPSSEAPLSICLTQFDLTFIEGNVVLNWETASEVNNARFIIYKNNEIIGDIPGSGTTSKPIQYSFHDKMVIPGETYIYKIADCSFGNNITICGEKSITVMIENNTEHPFYILYDNYPNPFNPSTTIRFELTQKTPIKLEIYNIHGNLVRSLIDGLINTGNHEVIWSGNNNEGFQVESGMYIARIESGNTSEFIKMLFIK